jgi:hypothetical protein
MMIARRAGRTVIEDDFRMEEFRDAKPEDYEFREPDGKLVRKDRWERGIRKMASILNMNGRSGFEIEDVIKRVGDLNAANAGWQAIEDADFDFHLRKETPPAVDLKFATGTILCGAERLRDENFLWNGQPVPEGVVLARFRYSE